jgi:hypothetical protein
MRIKNNCIITISKPVLRRIGLSGWNRVSSFILFIPIIISSPTFAQNSFGDILDTIMINDKPALLFSNKRWAYLDDHNKCLSYDSLFSQNWETKEIHAYLNERNKPIHDKTINLLENNSTFVFPLDTFKYLRGFKGSHTGLDLKADFGDSIRAAFDGRVRFADNIRNGYGNLVIIRHFNGLETYYSHLSKILVQVDDVVSAGDVIGLVGQTGRATTHHLHFETRYRDKVFDPLKLLSLQEKNLLSDSLEICKRLFGQEIYSPNRETTVAGGTDLVYHTVISGDTLYKISRLYSTSVDDLCKWNKISKTSTLRIGQKIKVTP